MNLIACVCLCLALAGCGGDKPKDAGTPGAKPQALDTPEAAYAAFQVAWQKRDLEAALAVMDDEFIQRAGGDRAANMLLRYHEASKRADPTIPPQEIADGLKIAEDFKVKQMLGVNKVDEIAAAITDKKAMARASLELYVKHHDNSVEMVEYLPGIKGVHIDGERASGIVSQKFGAGTREDVVGFTKSAAGWKINTDRAPKRPADAMKPSERVIPDNPVTPPPVTGKDGTPSKDYPPAIKDGAVKDGPVKDGPVKDGPVKDGRVKDGAIKDGPVKDGPIKDGRVKDGPVK